MDATCGDGLRTIKQFFLGKSNLWWIMERKLVLGIVIGMLRDPLRISS